MKWEIITDANGNISMRALYYHLSYGSDDSSSWVGAELTGSTAPVPWRLIPADGTGRFY